MAQPVQMEDAAAVEGRFGELAAVVERLRSVREEMLTAMAQCPVNPTTSMRAAQLRAAVDALASEAAFRAFHEQTIRASLSELRHGNGISEKALDKPLKKADPAELEADQSALLLSGVHWNAIPQHVFSATQLTTLDFSHNHLTALPEELALLPHLARLDVSHNKLTVLPASLAKLTSLTHFAATHNAIATAEPGWTHGIGRMVVLALGNNALTDAAFPGSEFATALSLRTINLRHNQLTTIPASICRSCRELRSLHLDHNRIASAPQELARLSRLRYLTLSHNLLKAVPREIGELTNLIGLALAHNAIATPPELRPNLRVVHIEGNPYIIDAAKAADREAE